MRVGDNHPSSLDPAIATLLRSLLRDGPLPSYRFPLVAVQKAAHAGYVRFIGRRLAHTPAGTRALTAIHSGPEPLWKRALRNRGQRF